MNNILGSPARDKDFFDRERERNKIMRHIKAGGHMQITAPRRVGKTSILFYFIDNPIEGYHFVYADTEGIENQNEYFKKLYEEILKTKSIAGSQGLVRQLTAKGNSFLRKIKAINLSEGGIEFHDKADVDYEEELNDFIKGIDLSGEKIILLNDEFPYTIENIIEKDGDQAAYNFLKVNRALRQDPDISKKLQIVYTGSIGLNALVERLGRTELINDIAPIGVGPLNENEAVELIYLILNNYDYSIAEEQAKYIIERVDWLIPFHIKLVLEEIMNSSNKEEVVTNNIIDFAFNQILDYKNNNYFDHYYSRLRKHFKGKEFDFALAVLCFIADKGTISPAQINNLAVGNKLKEHKSIIGTLTYDGYINNNDDPEIYRFNSPIIKLWWKKYVCK